jgi:hypothetical protein
MEILSVIFIINKTVTSFIDKMYIVIFFHVYASTRTDMEVGGQEGAKTASMEMAAGGVAQQLQQLHRWEEVSCSIGIY